MVMSLFGRRATTKWVGSSGRLMAHYSREAETLASSGDEPSPEGPPDYRSEFTNYLSDPKNQEKADRVAFYTVGLMNHEMVRNKVPMSLAHYEAATESLGGGDTLCGFLVKENKHVLDSTGSGFIYNAGYAFHTGLSSCVTNKE
jgi:hypothetical protein